MWSESGIFQPMNLDLFTRTFPRLPFACFPALSTGYKVSRVFRWLHVFPALSTDDVLLRVLLGLLRYSKPPDWLIPLELVLPL